MTAPAQDVTLREFVARIPHHKQVPGYAYLSEWDVKGAILAMEHVCPVDRRMRLMLFQSDDGWACVAEVPLRPEHGNEVYVRFSPLGFIALWNAQRDYCRIDKAHCQVELLQDVREPQIFRHPAMMPMEMKYDPKTRKFNKRIIYHTETVGAQ